MTSLKESVFDLAEDVERVMSSNYINTLIDYDADSSTEEDKDETGQKLKMNPCLNNFINFRDSNMKILANGIFKSVIDEGFGEKMNLDEHKILYQYDLYLADKEEPFDSNWLTKRYGVSFEAVGICVLPGLAIALQSMKYEEASLFWISHELMYGELGMCDKIPRKADMVARIKIERIYMTDGKTEIKPALTQFEAAIRSAKKIVAKGKQLFEKGCYEACINKYTKIINELENLHYCDEIEEKQAKDLLSKFYLNICVCYNKIKNPQKTCLAMRQLERLTSIRNNPKALYHKARALIMLDAYDDAKKLMKQVLNVEPNNKSAIKALTEIAALRESTKNYKAIVNKVQMQIMKENVNMNGNDRIALSVLNKK